MRDRLDTGPHQVAQNSTTLTFPLPSVVTGVPLTKRVTLIAGARSPMPRSAAKALGLVIVIAAAAVTPAAHKIPLLNIVLALSAPENIHQVCRIP
jgi:hypothetical protein